MKRRPSGKKAKAVRNGSQAALLRALWQAAVNLRGSIEPADYKRYVLPIIYPDEYRSHGAFIIPKRARWEETVTQAQAHAGSNLG